MYFFMLNFCIRSWRICELFYFQTNQPLPNSFPSWDSIEELGRSSPVSFICNNGKINTWFGRVHTCGGLWAARCVCVFRSDPGSNCSWKARRSTSSSGGPCHDDDSMRRSDNHLVRRGTAQIVLNGLGGKWGEVDTFGSWTLKATLLWFVFQVHFTPSYPLRPSSKNSATLFSANFRSIYIMFCGRWDLGRRWPDEMARTQRTRRPARGG